MSWDNARAPAVTIAPGDTVDFKDIDAMMGQISPQSRVQDLATLDFGRINPIAGPVYVDGAEPGDTLKVTILGFEPSGWAWTGVIPDFGLLAEDFPAPALHIWSYDKSFSSPAAFGSFVALAGLGALVAFGVFVVFVLFVIFFIWLVSFLPRCNRVHHIH